MNTLDADPYSIGDLERPSGDDLCFASQEDAEVAAIEKSIDDSPYGVWRNSDGELLSIAYALELFTK
jgi:ribosome recycling factor